MECCRCEKEIDLSNKQEYETELNAVDYLAQARFFTNG